MCRGSSRSCSSPKPVFPVPAASSPKASNPLPDKPSQEAAGEKEKEKERIKRMEWAILAISPGLQLVGLLWRPPDWGGGGCPAEGS